MVYSQKWQSPEIASFTFRLIIESPNPAAIWATE